MEKEIPFINQPVEEIGRGHFSTVYELENDPRFVVKEYHHERSSNEEAVDLVAEAKKEFSQLKQAFDRYVPDTDFVLAKGTDDQANLFIVQNKILGEQLSDALFKRDNQAKTEFEQFITEAVKQYIANYNPETRSAAFLDIKDGNLIWGKRVGKEDSENQLYYIDSTGLFFNTATSRLDAKLRAFEEGGLDLKEARAILDALRRRIMIEVKQAKVSKDR